MNQFVDPNGRADSFLDIILSHFQVPMSAKSSFNLEIFLREKAAPPWMLRANHVLAGRPRVWGLAVGCEDQRGCHRNVSSKNFNQMNGLIKTSWWFQPN